MNQLQRKIKRLNENAKRLMYEVVQADLTKTLANLINTYLLKSNDFKQFNSSWESVLRSGAKGFQPYKDSKGVQGKSELTKFFNNTITGACNMLGSDPNIKLSSEQILDFLRNNKDRLVLKNTVNIADNILKAVAAQQQNKNLNYAQAAQAAGVNVKTY